MVARHSRQARSSKCHTCSALMGPCFQPSARPVAQPEAAPFQAAQRGRGAGAVQALWHVSMLADLVNTKHI